MIPPLAIIIFLCTFSQNANAQEINNNALPLSLNNCIETGLENNFSLRIVRNMEQISSNNATLGNAGYLPKIDLSTSYRTSLDNTTSTLRSTGDKTTNNNVFDQTYNAGVNLNWTIFDGFNIQTNYKKLKELERQGETNTRIAIEDFIAGISVEYYNYIQQSIRLSNLQYSMILSKERLRIVEERYRIGSFSGLDYQQAKVDYNADHAKYLKQQEVVISSGISLNKWMAIAEVAAPVNVADTSIVVSDKFNYDSLYENMMTTNTSLLKAEQNQTLAQLDYKKVISRNYPYLSLNAGYGYTFNKYDIAANSKRSNLGLSTGVTLGITIFDGNRSRERQNADITIQNSQLQRQELELSLKANLSNLWQSYINNLKLVKLEEQNLITAKDNYSIAHERYMLGDLSGIEMREAQKSLLDAEERLLTSQFNTKVCEISLLLISGSLIASSNN